LDIESSAKTKLRLACWSREHFERMAGTAWFRKEHPGVRAPEQLRKKLTAWEPETVELGEQALANLRRHGAPTWYEWCAREWGTKWNACRVKRVNGWDKLRYRFDTAWDVPHGIVEALFELADRLGLSMTWEAEHEDGRRETVADAGAVEAAPWTRQHPEGPRWTCIKRPRRHPRP
jgi:hypothetical protein